LGRREDDFESAAAVGLVELRAEGFVLEHDVENVAQHSKATTSDSAITVAERG